MKRHIATLFALLLSCSMVNAQSIVEHLQKNEEGKGKITVKHSKEIDNLVNGGNKTETPQPPAKKQDDNKAEKKAEKHQEPDSTVTNKVGNNEHKNDDPAHDNRREVARHSTTTTESENESKVVDTRKKVMRNAHKVTGYRVQVFSGGSSRQDRQKAQNAGNKIKAKYPDLPVYVHFYSPSWKCRVGNFRSYEEASKVLKQVKALGYHQACIVKGKITVQ